MPRRPPIHRPRSLGPKHVPKRKPARRRAPTEAQQVARKIRSSARWQRLQRVKMSKSPLCQHPDCGRGRVMPAPAEDVHHIIPIEVAPELALTYDNLASLCKPCHSKITRQEASGIDTSGLF